MKFAVQFASYSSLLLLGASILSGGGSVAAAQDAQILVYNDARVEEAVLDASLWEAARIFRMAGIRLEWVNCSKQLLGLEKDFCRLVADNKKFVLRVISTGKTSSDLVFGQAYLGDRGTGKYADVFLDRIKAAHAVYGTNVTSLLAAVCAHELGHLLLGFQAHSWTGIMTPVWEAECLRRISMGNLLFTSEQGVRMRSRLRRSDLHGLAALATTDTRFASRFARPPDTLLSYSRSRVGAPTLKFGGNFRAVDTRIE